jgi:hypothetical protein
MLYFSPVLNAVLVVTLVAVFRSRLPVSIDIVGWPNYWNGIVTVKGGSLGGRRRHPPGADPCPYVGQAVAWP